MGRYPDFLACPETLHIAIMTLAGRYFLSIDNLSMGDFYPAQHVISALDKDPAFDRGLTGRRIGDLAPERSIYGECRETACQQPENEAQHPTQFHSKSDAELPIGVGSLVVILKP